MLNDAIVLLFIWKTGKTWVKKNRENRKLHAYKSSFFFWGIQKYLFKLWRTNHGFLFHLQLDNNHLLIHWISNRSSKPMLLTKIEPQLNTEGLCLCNRLHLTYFSEWVFTLIMYIYINNSFHALHVPKKWKIRHNRTATVILMVIQENEISLTETYSCLIREQQVQPENWVKNSIFYGIYHFFFY